MTNIESDNIEPMETVHAIYMLFNLLKGKSRLVTKKGGNLVI